MKSLKHVPKWQGCKIALELQYRTKDFNERQGVFSGATAIRFSQGYLELVRSEVILSVIATLLVERVPRLLNTPIDSLSFSPSRYGVLLQQNSLPICVALSHANFRYTQTSRRINVRKRIT